MSLPALILAAGSSTRLRPFTDRLPKCLLPVAGAPMLERSLHHLAAAGVREVIVVTGFEAPRLAEAARRWARGLDLSFIDNAAYATTNNGYSLRLAARALAGRRFLLLDSDLAYDGAILSTLIDAGGTCLALRRARDLGTEEVKVAADPTGRVTGIGKEVALDRSIGESVGIEVFSPDASAALFAALERRIGRLGLVDEYYEAAFQEIVDRGCPIQAIDIAPHRAMEIDTPADLLAADAAFGATELPRRRRLRLPRVVWPSGSARRTG